MAEDLLRGAELHDHAEIHHRDAMAEIAHRAEIVADEEVGGLQLLLQADQQVDDLRPRRRVQRRGGLVQHDQLGVRDDGARDAHPLLLPGAELGRKLLQRRIAQAHPSRDLAHPPAPVVAREAHHAQRLGDGLADPHLGVEGFGGLLKDQLHLAAQVGRADVAALVDGLPLETYLTSRGLDEAEDAAADGGLAGARFAYQRERLALGDGEAHPVDRLHHRARARDGKMLHQPVDAEDVAHSTRSTGKWQRTK